MRQWFIGVLGSVAAVPAHMMMSEASLKLGAKNWRADILVYDRNASPLAVVECKRPDVALDAKVAAQAVRYNKVLNVSWIILTNGSSTLVWKRVGDNFVTYSELPNYEQMLCQR